MHLRIWEAAETEAVQDTSVMPSLDYSLLHLPRDAFRALPSLSSRFVQGWDDTGTCFPPAPTTTFPRENDHQTFESRKARNPGAGQTAGYGPLRAAQLRDIQLAPRTHMPDHLRSSRTSVRQGPALRVHQPTTRVQEQMWPGSWGRGLYWHLCLHLKPNTSLNLWACKGNAWKHGPDGPEAAQSRVCREPGTMVPRGGNTAGGMGAKVNA